MSSRMATDGTKINQQFVLLSRSMRTKKRTNTS